MVSTPSQPGRHAHVDEGQRVGPAGHERGAHHLERLLSLAAPSPARSPPAAPTGPWARRRRARPRAGPGRAPRRRRRTSGSSGSPRGSPGCRRSAGCGGCLRCSCVSGRSCVGDRLEREVEREGRARARSGARGGQRAAHLGGGVGGDVQAEAVSVRCLVVKPCLKILARFSGGDADAVVGDLDAPTAPGRARRRRRPSAGSRDARLRHRLARVLDQVDQDLGQLVAVERRCAAARRTRARWRSRRPPEGLLGRAPAPGRSRSASVASTRAARRARRSSAASATSSRMCSMPAFRSASSSQQLDSRSTAISCWRAR